MNDESLELMERYFSGELTAEERAAFDERLAADAAFRQEMEAYRKTIRLVRLEGRKALRSRLAAQGRLLDAEKKSPSRHRRWWAGLTVLLLALLGWWFWGEKTETPSPVPPADHFVPDTARTNVPMPPDTSVQGKPSDKKKQSDNSSKQPAATDRPNKDKLFAAYFQPYQDDSLEPSFRGEGEATPEETFLQLYWDGQHWEALAAFEKMEPASKNKGDLQFLQANCLLVTGQAKAAKMVLEDLGRTRFSAEAQWLLALAYLKNGEREKARAMLQQIANGTASPSRDDAFRLLKALD